MWNNATTLAFADDDDFNDGKLSTAIYAAETSVSAQVQATLYTDFGYVPQVQLALAENPECHGAVLWALAKRTSFHTVLEAIIENPSAPDSLLLSFIEGRDLTLYDLAFDVLAHRLLDEAMNP